MKRTSWFIALALTASASAHAQELSARPTLFFTSTELSGHDILEGGLHIGFNATTPEFGAGFTIEAGLSVFAIESQVSAADVPSGLGPGIAAGSGRAGQFNQFYDNFFSGRPPHFEVVDNSSYLRFGWRPLPWHAGEGLSLTVMPLHSSRIYLGYEFPAVAPVAPVPSGLAPGARLELRRERWYLVAAVKTAETENWQIHEPERGFSEFAGGGVDLFSALRLEVEGAHADMGVNATPQDLGVPLAQWAAAARLEYHHGAEIGPPTDFYRYGADPAKWENLLRPAKYEDAFSARVFGEGLLLVTTGVSDPDEFGAVTRDASMMGAIEGRVMWRKTRAYLRMQLRTLSWNTAATPFGVLPDNYETPPELSATLTADHRFESAGLTPGLSFGITRPSSITAMPRAGGNNGFGSPRTDIIGSDGSFEILGPSETVQPLYLGEASLRWDWRWVSLVSEVLIQHDPNGSNDVDPALGVSEPEVHHWRDTFYFFAQGRFE